MDRHDTLLIASTSQENRKILRDALSERYNLLEAGSVRQAILLLKQNKECIAAALLDITDPEQMNRPLLEKPENQALLEKVPVILVAQSDDARLLNLAYGYGAADVLPIGYDATAMLRRVETVRFGDHPVYLWGLCVEKGSEDLWGS